jgi:predicted methyltransferase
MKKINTLVAAAFLCGLSTAVLAAIPSYVSRAVSDPARGKDAEADARRHPAELVTFAQVKPGGTVVDLIPGSGYFTRVFSQIVGPHGHVYAIVPNEYAKEDADEVALMRALAKDPHYSNVTLLMQPAAQLSIPTKADVVWTSQNYHDYPDKFMGPTDPRTLDAAVLKVLKPGGVFIVVDHVAEAGSGMRDTDTLHRIDPQVVREQVTASGFKFDGESDVLRNPADNHKLKVFDPAIRGHTDQFAFRFRKPK